MEPAEVDPLPGCAAAHRATACCQALSQFARESILIRAFAPGSSLLLAGARVGPAPGRNRYVLPPPPGQPVTGDVGERWLHRSRDGSPRGPRPGARLWLH